MKRRRLLRTTLTAAQWRGLHLSGNRSKIASDIEVRRFVDNALRSMSFVEIARVCRENFGEKRAPGKSAIGRYWLARAMRKRRK